MASKQIKENSESDLDQYLKINEFAQKEINRVANWYKLLAWSVTILFSVGAVILYLNFGNSKAEIERTYEERYQKLMNQTIFQIKIDLDSTWRSEKDSIKRKIEQEFSKDSIRLLVRNSARIRIDSIAPKIISTTINESSIPDAFNTYYFINEYYNNAIEKNDAFYLQELMNLYRNTKNENYKKYALKYLNKMFAIYKMPTESYEQLYKKRFGDYKMPEDELKKWLVGNIKTEHPSLDDFFYCLHLYNKKYNKNTSPIDYESIK